MNINLVYDTYSKKSFGGSCGIVVYFFRKAFQQLGYRTKEIYIPLSDKTSPILISKPKASANKAINFVFEELYPRCIQSKEFRAAKNITFFNLAYFSKLPEICKSDVVLFNSKFLMQCFLTEVVAQGLVPPKTDWIPLPLPLLEFPNGYPSSGGRISMRAIKQLKQECYLGHALRPKKQDFLATLFIVQHLNDIAKKKSTKPFYLLISEVDMASYKETIQKEGLQETLIDFFYPLPHLNNKSMISIMKKSDFGLCYDKVLEAFGFYPIESVYCRSPVFTNGAGNVRHLLPKNHGIYVFETLGMYFGSQRVRSDAYRLAAKRIFHTLMDRKKTISDCKAGVSFIEKNYSLKSLIKRLQPHLGDKTTSKTNQLSNKRLKPSPYLRLADWEKGYFVTDRGIIESKKLAKILMRSQKIKLKKPNAKTELKNKSILSIF